MSMPRGICHRFAKPAGLPDAAYQAITHILPNAHIHGAENMLSA
jgi:hypothetical protein